MPVPGLAPDHLPALAERLPTPWRDEAEAAAALRRELDGLLDWSAVRAQCEPWIRGVRAHPGPPWALETLLHEFPLTSHEGRAMMRLAEALLRVPDGETAMALTADQLHTSLRPDPSLPAPPQEGLLASLAHRVLALGKAVLPPADHAPSGWLQRAGASTVVAATVRSVQLLGQQFVLAQTAAEALARADAQRRRAAADGQRLCFSMDMLGEGARSFEDADGHLAACRQALSELSAHARAHPHDPAARPVDGLSIKLSALHPRLESTHAGRVRAHLGPRLLSLALQAAEAGLPLTLDAEESWRLELQLTLLEDLLEGLGRRENRDATRAWNGLGLAVQAYQHRAPAVIDELERMARTHARRLNVRLVKGAYWDAEVKRSQELGLPGFPVYTRKAHTDLSYLACAAKLLKGRAHLFPQFATHNAATVAAVAQLARTLGAPADAFEWQRLHGMGEATWREILADPAMNRNGAAVLRVYAPVGAHRDLLAYLVRRLLENGANASFVHQLVDPAVPVDALLASPLIPEEDAGAGGPGTVQPEPVVRHPMALFEPERRNSPGRDLQHGPTRQRLDDALARARGRQTAAQAVPPPPHPGQAPALMAGLHAAVPAWDAMGTARIAVIDAVADRLEREMDDWAADLVLEGRKTWADAVAEVRETIDFARYYAAQARHWLAPRVLPGPTGERNEWRLRPRGVWVCISPWNFPLAIFGGQVMAALLMGNAVAAKPAEQTPRIALRLTAALHEAGVPADALACVCGPGSTIGAALVQDRHCAGVAFTGSTGTAMRLQHMLLPDLADPGRAERPLVPLIAETGGVNALIADSTALPEQLLDSVMASAFGSAGQRCSALRLLCLHEATADAFESLLAAALDTLVVGDPALWDTDVGPVIDHAAGERLGQHQQGLAQACAQPGSGVRLIGRSPPPRDGDAPASSAPCVRPAAYALPSVSALRQEHFGPLLHVVRWGPGCTATTLDALVDQINALGFGLTLGVHTRIDARVAHIARHARVGNIYVNRGMTGAVVGSQPFGGQALSGTGPKAGGPLYLPRFATEQVVCNNTAAAGGDAALMAQVTR